MALDFKTSLHFLLDLTVLLELQGVNVRFAAMRVKTGSGSYPMQIRQLMQVLASCNKNH